MTAVETVTVNKHKDVTCVLSSDCISAKKKDVVDLTAGFPDYFPPEHLTSALQSLVRNEDNILTHQYSKKMGHPKLTKILAKLYGAELKRELNPRTNVLVNAGGVHSLFCSISSIVKPGDEVITFQPAFYSYERIIRHCQGISVHVPLKLVRNETAKYSKNVVQNGTNHKAETNGQTSDQPYDVESTEGQNTGRFVFDEDELRSKFSTKTKLIIVNTPHNPFGKVFTLKELTIISKLCIEYGVKVISDEVYERMVLPPNKHLSIASLPGMWERTIKIGSAGKCLSSTGWKVGWCIGSDDMLKEAGRLNNMSIGRSCSILSEAIAIALEEEYERREDPSSYLNSLPIEVSNKVDQVLEMFRKVGLRPIKPEGSYYLIIDVSAIDCGSDEPELTKDLQFVKWLRNEKKVKVWPVSKFYDNKNKDEIDLNLVRVCCFKSQETLDKVGRMFEGWEI
ncbi:hypothetical protein HELRODRAFT_188199 [Helobdella robusta]|uniref:kynurenine--oxoglutarate transaminase n=1 Tax=Helobdella robusta TaxID=6412 RepID=T1FPR8_HELRO|nr:hypothetical protein HELRODRAFT_188199 [Helobdella robusta]ESO05853.1 hypothetical protein HELRODRAFT_188199 [Helobdella robusta]